MSERRIQAPVSVALLCMLLLACDSPTNFDAGSPAAPLRPEGESPRLAVMVVLDQMRASDLQRFRPLYRGGLARLLTQGFSFTEAYHGHANTFTAPGHASLVTGLHPSGHGIIGNTWYDRDARENIYCVGDSVHGRSPHRLLSSTLGDWLKDASPDSQVYAASSKDRSAVLLGGHQADAAFWFDSDSGTFISSSYYEKANPPWLQEFTSRESAATMFGRLWSPLDVPVPVDEFGIQPTTSSQEQGGFPRVLGSASLTPNTRFYQDYYATPFIDGLLGDLARSIISGAGLGQDDAPDLLALGFSALDAVGHVYGPDSPEYLDTLLRLDQTLGALLTFLDEAVGPDFYIVGLSADHGVQPIPSPVATARQTGRRYGTADVICMQTTVQRMSARLGEGPWMLDRFHLNREFIIRRGLSLEEAEEALSEALAECPAIARVWTRTQLEWPVQDESPYQRMFFNSHHPLRSPDVAVQLHPGILPMMRPGTTHGSPYPDDAHVPLLLWGPGLQAGHTTTRVETVDLAPTMAAFMGITPPEDLDGSSLSEIVSSSPHNSSPAPSSSVQEAK